MFDDRRKSHDRRVRRDPAAIPASGCRRQSDRRDRKRRYLAHPWWLLTNYSEEVEPPELQSPTDEQKPARGAPALLARLRRRTQSAGD
jgi:hypothetical protein